MVLIIQAYINSMAHTLLSKNILNRTFSTLTAYSVYAYTFEDCLLCTWHPHMALFLHRYKCTKHYCLKCMNRLANIWVTSCEDYFLFLQLVALCVEVQESESATTVTFSPYYPGCAPVQIINNFPDLTLRFRQDTK